MKTSQTSSLNLQVDPDEWDGISVSNCTWLSCESAHHLLDAFTLARRNRTQEANEFGLVQAKTSSLLMIDVLQESIDGACNDKNLVLYRIYFVDTPGIENFNEDPEVLRIQEGNLMNRGLLTLAEVITGLARDPRTFLGMKTRRLRSC